MRDDTSWVADMVRKTGLNVVGAQIKKYAKYNAFTVFIKAPFANIPLQQEIEVFENTIKLKLAQAQIKYGLIQYGRFRHGANFITVEVYG